jgi:hypothetical protein
MRNLNLLSTFRVTFPGLEQYGNDTGNGVFLVPLPANNGVLRVIASNGEGWEHISVSLPNRCPIWMEMEYLKRLFFEPHETVIQIHPPTAEYVNYQPHTLHLWRPTGAAIALPPSELVGPIVDCQNVWANIDDHINSLLKIPETQS